MTDVLLITVDGTVTRHEADDPFVFANEHVAQLLDVVAVGHPGLEPRAWIMAVDDFGASKQLPINRNAWAMYGRSPICGPAVFWSDNRDPIPEAVEELVRGAAEPLGHIMDVWLESHPEYQR